MNRELKFRAWDISERRMYNDIDFQSNKEYFSSVIMQFTGLHDKNDVPIYEGDILTPIKDIKIGLYVEWEKKECYFCLKTPRGFPPKKLTLNNVKKCEVIGNIYENENLLK